VSCPNGTKKLPGASCDGTGLIRATVSDPMVRGVSYVDVLVPCYACWCAAGYELPDSRAARHLRAFLVLLNRLVASLEDGQLTLEVTPTVGDVELAVAFDRCCEALRELGISDAYRGAWQQWVAQHRTAVAS
jgi:hypothetical protein